MSLQKNNLGFADLHVHSNFSDGHASISSILNYAENHTKLTAIAITDHNTIDGAKEAIKIAKNKKYKIQVIVGEEISTLDGHVIGLFLTKKINPGMSIHDTLMEIKAQNGLAVMAHPLYYTRMTAKDRDNVNGVGFINLIKEKDNYVGIETYNATTWFGSFNSQAQFLNRTLLCKAETGGSDTHILKGVGKGYTVYEGNSVEDLKTALINGTTQAGKGRWGVRTLAKYAICFFPRGLKVFAYTITHGRAPKRAQITKFKYSV